MGFLFWISWTAFQFAQQQDCYPREWNMSLRQVWSCFNKSHFTHFQETQPDSIKSAGQLSAKPPSAKSRHGSPASRHGSGKAHQGSAAENKKVSKVVEIEAENQISAKTIHRLMATVTLCSLSCHWLYGLIVLVYHKTFQIRDIWD